MGSMPPGRVVLPEMPNTSALGWPGLVMSGSRSDPGPTRQSRPLKSGWRGAGEWTRRRGTLGPPRIDPRTRPQDPRAGMAGGSFDVRTETACGVLAGPVFVAMFTAIGATRAGYEWRRHAVSSLATGREGWAQRANFCLTGGLYCVAARGLGQSPRRVVGPSVVPALTFAAGAGLIGSGLFVTDPVAGFPRAEHARDRAVGAPPELAPTRSGQLHNLCAIPIFVGIPAAALVSAGSAARRREYRWAAYSAGSAIGMTGTSVLFGAAFGGAPRLIRRGGLLQRISITTGFAWLSALSLRARGSSPHD